MEISAEKTKLMTNSANGIQREIKVKGQKLGTVTSFKYLGAVVSDDDWLVGCFGFNGPLRQYFSLYRAVSQREGEIEEKG